MTFQIDAEFQGLIPPLTDKEFEQLEANVIAEGCRDALVVWQEGALLLDGHNRYNICSANDIAFETVGVSLPDREAAINWIIDNQLGRRNLTPHQASYLRGKRYNNDKAEQGGTGANQYTAQRDQNDLSAKTADRLAVQYGVSAATIKRDEKFAESVDLFEPETKSDILSGQNGYKKQEIIDARGEKEILEAARKIRAKKTQERNKQREARLSSLPEAATIKAERSPQLWMGTAENLHFLDEESVDIIITSPPYNLGKTNWPMGGDGRAKWDGVEYNKHEDVLPQAQYEQWQLEVFRELYRIARAGASFFYNHKTRPVNGRLIHPMQWVGCDGNPWILRQEIIWDRTSTHNHSASLFWPEDERVYWMTKGKPKLPDAPVGMSTVWRFYGPTPNTWHPAPFSEELPERCLQAVGCEGAIVLDPFAGSCTTLDVALAMGFDAIGVDISREYLSRAAQQRGWNEPQNI